MSYTTRLEFKDLGRTSLYLNLLVTSTSSLCFHLEFQRTRQGIHHLEPGFTGLGILYHAGTHGANPMACLLGGVDQVAGLLTNDHLLRIHLSR